MTVTTKATANQADALPAAEEHGPILWYWWISLTVRQAARDVRKSHYGWRGAPYAK